MGGVWKYGANTRYMRDLIEWLSVDDFVEESQIKGIITWLKESSGLLTFKPSGSYSKFLYVNKHTVYFMFCRYVTANGSFLTK